MAVEGPGIEAFQNEKKTLYSTLISSETILAFLGTKKVMLDILRHVNQTNEIDEKSIVAIIDNIMEVLPRNVSRECRLQLCATLSHITKLSPSIALCALVNRLRSTSIRLERIPSSSISISFNALIWVNCILSNLPSNEFKYWMLEILPLQSQFLNVVLRDGKPAIIRSALHSTRRCYRSLFLAQLNDLSSFISFLLNETKPALVLPKALPLYGVILGTCYYFQLSSEPRALASENIDPFVKMIPQHILAAKPALHRFAGEGFCYSIGLLLSLDKLSSDLLPSIEKALLRSPELVFAGILSSLAIGFADSGKDASSLLLTSLYEAFASNLKSSNATVRQNCFQTFSVLCKHAKDSKMLMDVALKLVSALKTNKVTSNEHRNLYIECLSHLSVKEVDSASLLNEVLPLFMKVQESSFYHLAAVVTRNVKSLLSSNISLSRSIYDFLSKSLDKPVAYERQHWILALADLAWDLRADEPSRLEFLNFYLEHLNKSSKAALSNPTNALQNGSILAPVVYSCLMNKERSDRELTELKSVDDLQSLLDGLVSSVNGDTILFSNKIINKLTTDSAKLWWLRGLCNFASVYAKDLTDSLASSWFQSIINLFNFSGNQTSKIAFEALKNAVLVNPGLRKIICSQFWNLHYQSEASKKDDKFDENSYKKLVQLLKSILLTISSNISDVNPKEIADYDFYLIELLFLSFAYVDQFDWIQLCQLSHRDPATLVTERIHDIVKYIEVALSSDVRSEKEKAMISSISMIVFVAPEASTPLFVNLFRGQLVNLKLADVSDLEYEIWKTPDGILWENVLEKKTQKMDKNTKDYETKRWEAEVRAKQAERKPMKLNKDQQALVDAQLEKESKIRQSVRRLVVSLERGLGIIQSMGNAVQLCPGLWVEEAIDVLVFGKVLHLSTPFTGDLALVVFKLVVAASGLPSRLGESAYSDSLAITILNALNANPSVDESIIDSFLYKVRFAIEQAYFEPEAFSCIFPLVNKLCYENATKDDEKSTEHLLLAIEMLGFQAPYSFCLRGMRAMFLKALLHLLETVPAHYQDIKNSLLSLVQGIRTSYTDNELNILLQHACHNESSVRSAVLQSLQVLDLTQYSFIKEIFLELYDDNESNAAVAHQISTQNGLDANEDSYSELLPLLDVKSNYLHTLIGKSFVDLIDEFEDFSSVLPKKLMEIYSKNALPSPPEYDEYGIIKKETIGRDLGIVTREGVSIIFVHISQYISSSLLVPFLEFLLSSVQSDAQIPVTDSSVTVASNMLVAGKQAITAFGSYQVEALMELFETKLNVDTLPTEANDRLREATVVLFGTVAQHLRENDQRLVVVIENLISALSTPSESVQLAVASCISPLIKKLLPKAKEYYDRLTTGLINASSFAERKGTAYGLAGLVKGLGIKAFKDFDIMAQLCESMSNRQSSSIRQGALFCVEAFSRTLGIYFEPYLPDLLPLLLSSFGDSATEVREATLESVKHIMSQLSAYGVKLLLPSLLDGLNDYNWRSKRASVEILGLMSFMAPKQLSVSLPTIVPKLTEVLTDSHSQVRNTANKSLLRFGEVISNPEIQNLVPILLKALSDCTRFTDDALSAILKTAFVHYLDSPSLALVIPIIQYGMRERNASTKRQSAKIFGLMASLTEPENLAIYLDALMPKLREVLIDPVPDTRATAAKALGSLMEKLGETKFPTLIPELFNILRSECSEVDRQGAAQGLSEVLSGLGLTRLEDVLPEILQNTSSPTPYIRESFISLLIYLPATFGARFQPYLARAIPPILSGLADESELVQTASLRAAKMIVNNYATRAVDLLLPELEKGLFDDNWRIRLSSVQLVGDLIYKLAGINKKTLQEETDESEEGTRTDVNRKALLETIGSERHDRVLSSLYILRQDIAAVVRTHAQQIWKNIVVNTPRTVRDIMSTLTALIVGNLNSTGNDRRAMCVKSLGDLLKKAGFDVLSQLLPSLKAGLESSDRQDRIGVCIALQELISSASHDQLEIYSDQFVYSVREALMDSDLEVRETAAEAFDILQTVIGDRAVDEVLPELLKLLESDDKSEYALSALKEIIARRSASIFPVLIPTLIKQPISAFNARALASLAQAAGPTLNRRLPSILNALMESILVAKDDNLQSLEEAVDTIVLSVKDQDGLTVLMAHLYSFTENEDYKKRLFAAKHMLTFFQNSKLDYFRFVPDWISHLVRLFEDRSTDVIAAAVAAQHALTSSMRKDRIESVINITYKSLHDVGVHDTTLPAFELPQGISSILPIFLHGLMHGTNEQREQSALGVADIVMRAEPDKLRPYVTQITGPLIRISGERFPVEVKSAILYTLNIILSKIPTFLRPFLPQLQRTFAKSLGDPSSEVIRSRAATALGTLITLQTRLAPIVTELVAGARTPDAGVRKAMLNALFAVVSKSGQNMNEASAESVDQLLREISSETNEYMIICAKMYGALFNQLTDTRARQLLDTKIFSVETLDEYSILILNAVIKYGSKKIIEMGLSESVCQAISDACQQKETYITENAVLAAGKALLADVPQNFNESKVLFEALRISLEVSPSGSQDSKRLSLVIIRILSKEKYDIVRPHLNILAPAVFSCIRAIVIPIKLAAEAAFLAMFKLVDDDSIINKYMETLEGPRARSFTDYTRRVAFKLAAGERDRIASGSGRIQLEEKEDLAEITAVGRDNEVISNESW
ncbi:translation elongation regulator Gcn1 [Schizosaccharomyces cryophilus OY26]|uniref:eIF-2-alpha kinase activator GCN1 n=1 Tax=Schizosaccharomyces cryophilus (strain OY26 / ATCC MYA-4695 / CBS 11777 / NBRC 106824 / NRRL Y48691) TaxID=653667 RepID=S9W134_SCHCR|nr:translation elongation regulator Gcn1 [Schizosaccharomyces cryophilus OY26]EPY51785.1 translation elongation regulator Gcn1 [Schizosaccharomyces cryophilus OY26]